MLNHRRLRGARRVFARALVLALVLPVLMGGVTPTPGTSADPLSDAQAQQQQLQKQIAAQKAKISSLAAQQQVLSGRIASTRTTLDGVNADLASVRTQVDQMTAQIAQVQATYDGLVAQIKDLDARLIQVRAEEAFKAQQLAARKALLAERIRNAYDQDRTTLLEIVLSSDSFTDVIAEAGYYMDIAEQDRVLAEEIRQDQAVLAEIHATVVYTREQTEVLRTDAAAQKQELDRQLAELEAARARLQALEAETKRLLAQQQAAYSSLAYTRQQAEKALADQAASQKALQQKINQLIAEQARQGKIPSIYNGSLVWSMPGTITQEFGCTGVVWEPPQGGCAHWHNGIDVAAPMYTPIKASGPGTVVFVGPNPYDPNPKAWIVIIAHSVSLRSWYAHIDNGPWPPAVSVGQVVRAGQVIAYEGMTGRTTGPHLHWMVELEGDFVNPRLFL